MEQQTLENWLKTKKRDISKIRYMIFDDDKWASPLYDTEDFAQIDNLFTRPIIVKEAIRINNGEIEFYLLRLTGSDMDMNNLNHELERGHLYNKKN